MTTTKGRKRSRPRVPRAAVYELVFVVDVSALTESGFVGATEYEGGRVDLEFDDGDAGVFLTPEMAGRLGVREGSPLKISVEGETDQSVDAVVASVGHRLRISNPMAYYSVGKGGGAVIRVRKG